MTYSRRNAKSNMVTRATWYSDTENEYLSALEELALYVGAMAVLVIGAAALLFIAYALPAGSSIFSRSPDNVVMLMASAGYFIAVLGAASIVTRHGG